MLKSHPLWSVLKGKILFALGLTEQDGQKKRKTTQSNYKFRREVTTSFGRDRNESGHVRRLLLISSVKILQSFSRSRVSLKRWRFSGRLKQQIIKTLFHKDGTGTIVTPNRPFDRTIQISRLDTNGTKLYNWHVVVYIKPEEQMWRHLTVNHITT